MQAPALTGLRACLVELDMKPMGAMGIPEDKSKIPDWLCALSKIGAFPATR
jgi:hypothetical protein